jgi:hypothetical protein
MIADVLDFSPDFEMVSLAKLLCLQGKMSLQLRFGWTGLPPGRWEKREKAKEDDGQRFEPLYHRSS